MTGQEFGRRHKGRSLDHLARAYREMLARDQAMRELLIGAAVHALEGSPQPSHATVCRRYSPVPGVR